LRPKADTTGTAAHINPHPEGVPEGSRWLRPKADTTGTAAHINPHPEGVPEQRGVNAGGRDVELRRSA
jgi:hypothetical protein